MKYLLSISIMILAFVCCTACKSTSKSSTSSTNENKTEVKAQSESQFFKIEFYSIGEGTDGETNKILEGMMYEYKQELKGAFTYENYPWGREGENDFCVNVSKLNSAQRKNLENKCNAIIAKGKNVRMSIVNECKSRRGN
jgi:hypothetical protein